MCTHFIKIWDGCAKNTKEIWGRVRTTNGHEWQGVTTKDMKWHSQAF